MDVGLLRGDSTETIANNILRLTMRNGRVVGVVRRPEQAYANIASTQINNTLDGAVWGQINQNLKIGPGGGVEPIRSVGSGMRLLSCGFQRTCPIMRSTPFEDRSRKTADVCLDGL